MLTELRISSLGVINEAVLELGPGFTAVTGETGAGKTMVVTSLGLLLGERAEARLIRQGTGRAVVEGRLSVDPDLAAAADTVGAEVDDGELLLTRVLTPTRSRALAGGVQVSPAALSDLVGERITIHGQAEQLRLGASDRQREVLDQFAGPDLALTLAAYESAYAEHRAVSAELQALVAQAQERARELALLEFGLTEIETAAPLPGEDAALIAEAKRLQAVDDLRAAARRALTAIAGDDEGTGDDPTAMGLVSSAKKALASIADDDLAVQPLTSRVSEAGYLLADVAGELASYLDHLDADPARLEWIAGRLSVLQGLTRRYGSDVDGVLSWSQASATRASELRGSDERIDALRIQRESLDADLTALASTLTTLRTAAASTLQGRVEGELAALAMPHATLTFAVNPGERGPHGADQISLLFSANPGSAPAPLAKVASGGELSRIRLALEVVLATGGPDQTFVFDEVDAGVGGSVALEIGRRLSRLAKHAQVIVVTHLAQVAAFADRHYVVAKSDDGQVTTSGVVEVADETRVQELARMMAGLDGTDAARAHALELLAAAR